MPTTDQEILAKIDQLTKAVQTLQKDFDQLTKNIVKPSDLEVFKNYLITDMKAANRAFETQITNLGQQITQRLETVNKTIIDRAL